jgi:hypothetical protein
VEKKQAEQEALEKAKAVQRAAGKMAGMTGRDMFQFGGELFEDGDDGDDEEDWDISRMLARYVSAGVMMITIMIKIPWWIFALVSWTELS